MIRRAEVGATLAFWVLIGVFAGLGWTGGLVVMALLMSVFAADAEARWRCAVSERDEEAQRSARRRLGTLGADHDATERWQYRDGAWWGPGVKVWRDVSRAELFGLTGQVRRGTWRWAVVDTVLMGEADSMRDAMDQAMTAAVR